MTTLCHETDWPRGVSLEEMIGDVNLGEKLPDGEEEEENQE